jgi:hypothetical protein
VARTGACPTAASSETETSSGDDADFYSSD